MADRGKGRASSGRGKPRPSTDFNGDPSQYFSYPKIGPGPQPNNGYSDPAVGRMFDYGADRESRSGTAANQLASRLGIMPSDLSPEQLEDARFTAGDMATQGYHPKDGRTFSRVMGAQPGMRGSFQDGIRLEALLAKLMEMQGGGGMTGR